jgi:hypothetical protein
MRSDCRTTGEDGGEHPTVAKNNNNLRDSCFDVVDAAILGYDLGCARSCAREGAGN